MSDSAVLNGDATLFSPPSPRFVADDFIAFDRVMRRNVQSTHRSVELQRIAAGGGGLRAAEHHADLHADLVDKITMQLAFLMVAPLRSAG
jgi:hypothetical protein